MLRHGENIVDSLGGEVDRIENNLKVMEGLNSVIGKAVANHAEVWDSIPITYVGKEPNREIFASVPVASV